MWLEKGRGNWGYNSMQAKFVSKTIDDLQLIWDLDLIWCCRAVSLGPKSRLNIFESWQTRPISIWRLPCLCWCMTYTMCLAAICRSTELMSQAWIRLKRQFSWWSLSSASSRLWRQHATNFIGQSFQPLSRLSSTAQPWWRSMLVLFPSVTGHVSITWVWSLAKVKWTRKCSVEKRDATWLCSQPSQAYCLEIEKLYQGALLAVEHLKYVLDIYMPFIHIMDALASVVPNVRSHQLLQGPVAEQAPEPQE